MKILNKLKKSEFWSGVIKLSAGQLISQLITLVATLALSRIYTDSDYGTYGIITSTATIIISVISMALSSAVMVVETDDDSKRVFTVAYGVQLVLLGIVIVGIFYYADSLCGGSCNHGRSYCAKYSLHNDPRLYQSVKAE